jgi:hypothetical protein
LTLLVLYRKKRNEILVHETLNKTTKGDNVKAQISSKTEVIKQMKVG